MKITKVIINNYRSIGSEHNCLDVESSITAIVGKNESGKSSILEAIGGLSLLKPLGNGYLRNRNRHSPDEALVSVTVELEFEPHEIREHSMDPMPTTIDLDSTRVVVRGGLKKLISEDRQLLEVIERLCETRNDASIWGQGNSRVKEIDKIFASLGDIETTIFGEYESKLRTLTNWVTGGRKELIAGDVEFIVQRIQSYYGMLPRVHYWDSDREFLYSYSFEQIQASFADERHMFSRFLKAGRISRDEIIKALTHPNEGVRENARCKPASLNP
jgi:energy-coupling factor transporter ATP-binding protein EcfA2